ncbi:hypothetical protein K402DRAFT_450328 [Aulographum hederae CBS 113979]|uniref:FAD-binding FR-type domain-containing protein n=1 Tax=Aulographum hederae CBS 113979 TaxID=1176131 RepID=A0A6G1HE86_9PEZI|nr:hypothetical protein K402DRAFT_450328 [Aulographum hederae CBS 113979]
MPSQNPLPRHIQDMDAATSLEHHWGYSDRALPCIVDAGSCEYLDAVYHNGHDLSILYSWIMWCVIGAVFLLWWGVRTVVPKARVGGGGGRGGRVDVEVEGAGAGAGAGAGGKVKQGVLYRGVRATHAFVNRWLLPESFVGFFGHVSRLQILILAVICTYLTIFSFIALVYKTWITPVKGTPFFNTRTGMGPFSDRIGILAYALTPFTILLSSRESILSLLTGIPYQNFNFLHRWTGRVIFVQSFVHTLIWTIIEARLYQPQPKVWNGFIREQYIIFGVFAMLFISFLTLFSTRWMVRLTGYEFFRKTHYAVGFLYVAACWGHWTRLAVFMIASLALMGVDRGLRLLRSGMIHFGYKDGNRGWGFRSAQAEMIAYDSPDDEDGTVVRLDFTFNHDPWIIGQHFYLCFPGLTVWQSHPFTPMSIPAASPQLPHHTYIIRAFKGETARLAKLALEQGNGSTTPVVLGGPYGTSILGDSLSDRPGNVLGVAGGTGITFVLPALIKFAETCTGAAELVWMIRRTRDVAWLLPELTELKEKMKNGKMGDFKIRIFVTRDVRPSNVSGGSTPVEEKSIEIGEAEKEKDITYTTQKALSADDAIASAIRAQANFEVEWLKDHHPSVQGHGGAHVLDSFIERARAAGGRSLVVGSGPPGLGHDLRAAIAAQSEAGKVWRGELAHDVELCWDDRLVL